MAQVRTHPDELVSEAQLAEMTRRIVELCHPRQVILFGSYASGRATNNSDIDLMVVVDGPWEPRRRRELAVEIRMEFSHSTKGVDIVVVPAETLQELADTHGNVYFEALAGGRLLYDAKQA